jgi:hypothetical protein
MKNVPGNNACVDCDAPSNNSFPLFKMVIDYLLNLPIVQRPCMGDAELWRFDMYRVFGHTP